jgi:hypothetical protein
MTLLDGSNDVFTKHFVNEFGAQKIENLNTKS